ncbi:MAG: rod shape-determining protein MreC [Nanoarchaeota archaeon]|nr:rod shape-determining protein MreC [Nanoarchaeota archaeon]
MRSFGIYIVFCFLLLAFFLFVFFYRGIARGVFSGSDFFSDIISSRGDALRVRALQAENARLKEEVFRLESTSRAKTPPDEKEVFLAGVYSRYPFLDKQSIIIDFGSREGALPGMPVLAGESFLIGEIVSTSKKQSEVRTIFDARWVGSVFVRLSSSPGVTARGVLKGGAVPRVELISSEFPLREGDVVVNASEKFPFALPIGVLLEPKKGGGGFWEDVPMRPIVGIRDTYNVSVLRNFP